MEFFTLVFNKITIYFFLTTALLLLCFCFFFLNIGDWLTTADLPRKAEVAICLAGTNDRIEKVISLLHNGLAEKVVATTSETYQVMLREDVSPENILKADWSAKSTYEEGLLLKSVLDKKVKSVMVVTDPFHLYRAKWTFQHIFPDGTVQFSFISSDAPTLRGFWWSNIDSRLLVLNELPKIVYYWFWHGLLHQKYDTTWVSQLKCDYNIWLTENFGR
jgi:uncharacterized SAM-binding protein YcdF (DUF218 family)